MLPLLQILRALHADYRQGCPQPDEAGLGQAEQIFNQVEADREQGRLLTYLDQYVVPTMDFAQAYYNLNTPTTEHLNDFPGSLHHRIRVICSALKEQRDDYLGRNGFVMAVYPEYAVVCYREGYCYYDYSDGGDPPESYWSVPYTYDEATGEVQFGAKTPVEVKTVVVPAGAEAAAETEIVDAEDLTEGVSEKREPSVQFSQVAATNADGADLDQAAKFKTENGQKFSQNAYLIVPDAEKPSTWKVRVEESPGKVTVAQLGAAHAALFSAYRGQKLQAEPAQVAGAKRKLRSLYKSHKAPFPGDKNAAKQAEEAGYPLWLLQGEDPPGGDQDLVQTITVLLQQQGEIEENGVMHVEGIATVADIISKNNEVYPLAVWQENMPRMQSLIEQGRLLGEADHPADNRPSLQHTVFKYTSIWQEDAQYKFKADILPTIPDGQNLQTLVKNGVAVDISSRGRGRMAQGTWQGIPNVGVVQSGFRVDAFDAVLSGASTGSTITDWTMAQAEGQSPTTTQEETEMGEISDKILEAIQGLGSRLEKLEQGSGPALSAASGTEAQNRAAASVANDSAVSAVSGGTMVTHTTEEVTFIAEQAAGMRVEQELQAMAAAGWPQQWVNLLRKQIEQAAPKTLSDANAVIQSRKELVQSVMDQAPRNPGNGIIKKPGRGEGGPRTPNELIEKMVEGLPDNVPEDPMAFIRQDEEGNIHEIPDWVRSPRRQCRKMLQNVACVQENGFDGKAAVVALMRLEQGHNPQQVGIDFLNQSCADGATSVASGGAPTSAIFIFPLIRRAFPMLIATELASVQPMDRPSGKVFYLDAYRVQGGVSETDEGGSVSSSRMRIDRSESFNPSYSDRAAECDTAGLIQLHLSSKNVTAVSKALYATWTIEELQDLRAYHGLDVQTELMGAVARQIALEWNETVLNEMLTGATAGNVTYGTTAPSGYTAKEWEEYMPRYLDLASTKIFQKRHGEMTHIVAGPLAWLQLGAAYRTGTRPAGENPEQFAGLVLTPFASGSMSNVRTYKTSFWNGTNSNKILVIRRGPDWSDTPYVWAPYATYMSPTLTLPDVFTQKQGLLDRAAHLTTVGDAMATITINSTTGVPINQYT